MIYCEIEKNSYNVIKCILSQKPGAFYSYGNNGKDYAHILLLCKNGIGIRMIGDLPYAKYIKDLHKIISNTNFESKKEYEPFVGEKKYSTCKVSYRLVSEILFFSIRSSEEYSEDKEHGDLLVSINIYSFSKKNSNFDANKIIEIFLEFFEKEILPSLKINRK